MILDLSNILVNLRSTGQSLRPQANTLESGNNVSDPCDGVAVQHVLLVELTPHTFVTTIPSALALSYLSAHQMLH